ncbi:MAG: CRISPR-associated endonuclease Cas2, partial [Parcubacteria group bacterium]
VQEAILLTLASGGRLGASLLVPRVLNALLKLDIPSSPRKNDVIESAASRLRKKGLVVFKDEHYSLTKTGEKILNRWQMSDYRIERPKRWDRKWRVIIFDIPERKRAIRTEVRRILTEAGFQRLQDSVWVYPYDCENVIGLMKINLGIGKHLLYMIVDRIENDRHLRAEFDLL